MTTLPGGDEDGVDPEQLLQRALHYAETAGAGQPTLDGLATFLCDPVTRAILALPSEALNAFLVNDAYKPRMHKLYARYMTGVTADFELSVRKTPVPLAAIQREDPELWQQFECCCSERLGVAPYPQAVVEALNTHFTTFRCSEEMLARAGQHGVAPLSWRELGGDLTAFSHGPIEASSHVETTLTQLVQAVTLAAQVRRLERERGVSLSPTELLANSLGKLAAGVQRLVTEAAAGPTAAGERPPAMMLFAGRRSSSRRYLMLQNWYCMRHLPGYAGTSSVLAVVLLQRLLQEQGQRHGAEAEQQQADQQQQWREKQLQGVEEEGEGQPDLRLVGTSAHEVMMVADQLLGCYDDLSSSSDGSPAQICSLLAHLLLLAVGGGVQQATALSDTFGTRGFVSAVLAAALPQEFRDDMAAEYPDEWAALPAAARAEGARVFDLFASWRMDSGSYQEMASYVMDAWQRRWEGEPLVHRPPPPCLMHSNLDSYDDILEMWHLPPHIRPAVLAFGTLADGFLPFDLPPVSQQQQQQQRLLSGSDGGGAIELRMCSVVMKAVQASHPGNGVVLCCTDSAGKLGDDAALSKMQLDRRLPLEVVELTRRRLLALAREQAVDAEAASTALARAYHAVTRDRVLC